MSLATVDDVEMITLKYNHDPLGKLTVAETGITLPMDIRRVFVVNGYANATRGKHAHKQLTQILVCVSGACNIIVDDGDRSRKVLLDASEKALRIPPGIWAEQHFYGNGSVLMVLCDMLFDESDYIRDYSDFLAFRRLSAV